MSKTVKISPKHKAQIVDRLTKGQSTEKILSLKAFQGYTKGQIASVKRQITLGDI